MSVELPSKALRLDVEMYGHDRDDLADSLRDLASEIERGTSVHTVSSRGWSFTLTEQSSLSRAEYEEQLLAWSHERRSHG